MLTLRSLPLRTARYHWRSNLPVMLGVAVGSAVLAGALLVGDSLRGSLRDRALRQLNGVRTAYVGTRLVNANLMERLTGTTWPALLLQGSAQSEPSPGLHKRLDRVAVIGMDGNGYDWFGLPARADGHPQVVLSAAAADHLQLGVGGMIELGVEKMSAVPRSSVLGRRGLEDTATTFKLPVAVVLPPDHKMNEFGLDPNPVAPVNVFIPLDILQGQVGKPGRVNALLGLKYGASAMSASLADALTLDDWGIRVRVAEKRKAYVSVESEQLVLDPPTVRATEAAAKSIGSRSERTYSYLANAISLGDKSVWNKDASDESKVIGYSTVAALDPSATAPLGPFLPPGVATLADDEIVLLDWLGSPFDPSVLKPGDPVTVTYFKPEMEAAVEEAAKTFRFAGFVPLAGPADDPDLTPPFPGITDKLKITDWDSPFELNMRRVRPRDEEFWNKHKTTPKAYVTRAAGEKLWGSRFGDVTSVRVAPAPGLTVEQTADKLRAELPKHLDPAAAGLVFEPTRDRLLAASRGGTDFGALFLGFSSFLIASALLLVGLLFRLALDRRAKEVGLLLAAGYPVGRVRRLLLVEGVAVAAAGALLGLIAAVGYARGLIYVLVELWPDAEVGKYLTLHVGAGSLVAGFVGTVLMAAATLWFGLRGLVKVPAPALLRGETAAAEPSSSTARRPTASLVVAGVLILAGVGMLAAGGPQSNPDLRAMTFFGGGAALLAAGLLAGRAWLRWPRSTPARGPSGLGRRNASRNPTRSQLTAGLIASATFLLVAVESFRRRPDADFLDVNGGSGGFPLLAEADVPVFQPFDREPGKGDLLDRLREVYQKAEARDPSGPTRQQRLQTAEDALKDVAAEPFRLQGGDDASCLNLYQAGRPRVLGVPDSLVQRGGFKFAETEAVTAEEKANPWLLLTKPRDDGAVPVFVEQNTAMWMLKTAVGGELQQPDGDGRMVTLRIVGTLQDSVFQSELLMGDANFRRLYPRQEGFRVFLVGCPPDKGKDVAGLLETGLRANGLTVTPTRDRVAAYQKVVGTYLTTFQLLGGLGLLLGVLGLGVVVLRGVWERVGELALLRAVGYRTRALQTMVLAENLLLLSLGVGIGLLAAVASVAPNVTLGGSVNVGRLAGLLGAVVVAGVVVGVLATRSVGRVPLVPALRKD
jgi:putative ABC transport system permease protein